jgi:hypothetical protein
MWRRALVVLAGLSSTACAAAGPTVYHVASATRRDIITATEIVAAHVTDAYQAVAQLRPEFFRRRARTPVTPAMHTSVEVYLDELPYGNIESLRYIPLDRVRLIRYISPTDADMRWGGSHPMGAILVTTQR